MFILFIRAHRKHSSNAALVRKAKAKKKLKNNTAKAKAALEKNDPKGFYAALENGLVDYLSDISNREFRGMTRDQQKANLNYLGIDEEAQGKVFKWLEECAYARFAPAGGSAAELGDAIQKFEELCDSLEVHK